MGQTLSSETLSISGGDGYRYWVGLTMKPSDVGCKKTVYKGVLLGHGPRQWEKVVAKAFTDIPGTRESWKHELNKADVTKQLAAKFVQEYPSLCTIRIVIPGIVQMDRVSNMKKWLADKNDGRGLTQDEWISVEELIPGAMVRFCPWSTRHAKDHVESKYLQAFSHFTYKHTNGELVACDFQGKHDDKSSQYIFTDSSIHSTFQMYGLFDQGQYGISEFFKLHQCNEICSDWPTPTPFTPPPSFEAACMLQSNLTPASAFENIIFPASRSGNEAAHEYQQNGSERRRHCSERQKQLQRRTDGSLFGHSIDLPVNYFQRQLNVSSQRVTTTRENVSGQQPPPSYENLALTMGTNNLPPHYDSLVNTGASSNPTDDLKSTSQFQNKHESTEQLIHNRLKSRQRSATAPLLDSEYTAEYPYSGACGATGILNSQPTGSHPGCKKCKSNPVFYCGEAMPSLVPSAPPEEGDDLSGT